MKHTITKVNITLSLLIILMTFHIDEYLIRLLITGELSSNIIIPAPIMLSLSALIGLAIIIVFALSLVPKNTRQASATTYLSQLPKRRYSEQ